ncbi:MAG: HPr family phosphocarrier protein [Maioricimonas sp. JB045]|uniref:HPr family phosphocarrier protein n=1 Tax=Maioricimonas sp. JC845 TaxID=3232138 RepID=UPI0034595800
MTESSRAERTVTVTMAHGLHMVPCSEIAKFVRDFDGEVRIRRDNVSADAHSVFDLLQLQAEQGALLVLEATGEGAESIVDGLARLFEAEFHVER